jgi:hypothetical protein
MMRDRSPLAWRPLQIRKFDHPLIMLGFEPQNRLDPPRGSVLASQRQRSSKRGYG